MAKNLKITLHHGIVNRTPAQRATVKTLGLNKIGKTVVREDTPANRGMADNEILQMHDLKPAPGAKKDRTRVGRGEGSKGKTAGRGAKGQTKRNHVRPGFEGGQLPLYMRLPKLRGFKNPFKVEFQVINIARLVELFPEGGEVAVADLIAKGAVRDNAPVKVLGDGETTVAFILKGVKVSASAKSKIEAAGGSVSED